MRKKLYLFFLGGFLILVLGGGYYLLNSSFLTIKQVEVRMQNSECVNPDDLKSAANTLNRNFLLINNAKETARLKEKFICLKSLNLIRQFPDKVIIEAFVREPVAVLLVLQENEATKSASFEYLDEATPSASEKLLLDNEGVLYSSEIKEGLPKIYIDSKDKDFKNVLKIFEKVRSFGINIQQTGILKRELFIKAVPQLIFDLDDRLDIQLASLQLILDQAKIDDKDVEFIDLRFDKPIVNFAPKK